MLIIFECPARSRPLLYFDLYSPAGGHLRASSQLTPRAIDEVCPKVLHLWRLLLSKSSPEQPRYRQAAIYTYRALCGRNASYRCK